MRALVADLGDWRRHEPTAGNPVSAKIFETELKARIEEEITRIRMNLSTGCATDYAQYRELVGMLKAYDSVANDYCDEIQVAINKR